MGQIKNHVLLDNGNEYGLIMGFDEIEDIEDLTYFVSTKDQQKLYFKTKNKNIEIINISEIEILRIKKQEFFRVALTDRKGDVFKVLNVKNIKRIK